MYSPLSTRVLDEKIVLVEKDADGKEEYQKIYPTKSGDIHFHFHRDTGTAVEKLRILASSTDPFLAAESLFSLARHYVASEHFEQALPLLHKLTGDMSDQTLREAEALLLRGIVQTGMLQRQEAIESFTRFLDENPNAPARLRAVAAGHLDLLEELELGSIGDIHEQMKFSRRRLSNEDSGKRTQEVQEDIVAMLNSIIEELEKKGGT